MIPGNFLKAPPAVNFVSGRQTCLLGRVVNTVVIEEVFYFSTKSNCSLKLLRSFVVWGY